MSNTMKVWFGVFVAIIIIAAIYMFMPQSSSAPVVSTAQSDTSVSSSTDTSDAAITQDMGNIDAQLSGIDASQKDVDASLNN